MIRRCNFAVTRGHRARKAKHGGSRGPFYVYVVELSRSAARKHRDVAAVRRGARVYYVGQTAHSNRQRLADHLRGGTTSSRAVREHAKWLVGHSGPFHSREDAERGEKHWAQWIRKRGHVALGGH